MPVGKLEPAMLQSAARLLADAFFTNPAHVYICPDSQRRRRQLEWLLGGNLRSQPDLEYSFCIADGADVRAMGFWTRSDGPQPGVARKLRAGALAAPLRLRVAGLRRLLEVTSHIDRALAESFEGAPFWYLNNMVVGCEQRGTGIGTRLLEEQIPIVQSVEPSFPLGLTTQRPENVVFYQRLGFRTVSDEVVGTGPAKFTNWVMAHPPAA